MPFALPSEDAVLPDLRIGGRRHEEGPEENEVGRDRTAQGHAEVHPRSRDRQLVAEIIFCRQPREPGAEVQPQVETIVYVLRWSRRTADRLPGLPRSIPAVARNREVARSRAGSSDRPAGG